MSTSRKPHRKTRTGCVSCKQRKVKCDEQKPSCTNCARRFNPCVYLPVGLGALATPESSPYTPNPSPHISVSSDAANQSNARPFDMLHLELLHNFSTSTCYSLSPLHKDEYRIETPKFAFSHDFVMHGLMAVSALHLAYLRQERREYYLAHAKAHHEAGLRAATRLISSLDEVNCVPLWIFSTLCTVFATARPRQSGDFVIIGQHGEADWFAVVRGCRAILGSYPDTLINSPFGAMFQSGISRGKLRDNATLETDLFLPLRQNMADSALDAETLAIYSMAIDELRKCFAVVYGITMTKPDLSDVFRWLWHAPAEYFQLLKQKEPIALSILAYFAVLVHPFSSYWWLEGFSRHIVATVYQSLDQNCRPMIRWPIEEVGGIPE